MKRITGALMLPSIDREEIAPGIFAIGEAYPRPDLGPGRMACLADVHGMLCAVELLIGFLDKVEKCPSE